MADLITLAQAKADLRILSNDQDADISLKIAAASEMVLEYANQSDPDWTEATAPALFKVAVLLTVRDLFTSEDSTGLTDGVKNILHRWRDPVLS